MPRDISPGGQGRRPVLLCLAGLSPAVVTEALYALAVVRRPPVYPSEIVIITTGHAVEAVEDTLLGPAGAIDYGAEAPGLCVLDLVIDAGPMRPPRFAGPGQAGLALREFRVEVLADHDHRPPTGPRAAPRNGYQGGAAV